jgi:hypothetical protein
MIRSFVYSEHHKALKSRIRQHDNLIREALEPYLVGDLWKLIQEANNIAPKNFSKASLWNKFVDLILEDDKHLEVIGLSADAIILTRYAQRPNQEPNISNVHLKNKLVFGKLVSGQNDETRPLYYELYEFLYNVSPEIMHLKVIRIFPTYLPTSFIFPTHNLTYLPTYFIFPIHNPIYLHMFMPLTKTLVLHKTNNSLKFGNFQF